MVVMGGAPASRNHLAPWLPVSEQSVRVKFIVRLQFARRERYGSKDIGPKDIGLKVSRYKIPAREQGRSSQQPGVVGSVSAGVGFALGVLALQVLDSSLCARAPTCSGASVACRSVGSMGFTGALCYVQAGQCVKMVGKVLFFERSRKGISGKA